MVKTCFCAAAMLIGAAIGYVSPAEWGEDTPRITRAAADLQPLDIAMAYRPHQR
jgi:hypothetical protein